MRQQVQIIIPNIYKENEIKGLCKVCGKLKNEWEKRRKKYCTQSCNDKYQECFLYWSTFASRFLKENPECLICKSKNQLQVDHIIPVAITNKTFDKNNLQTLCVKCHREKTKGDLLKIKLFKQKQSILKEQIKGEKE